MKKILRKITSIFIILTFMIPSMVFGEIADHGAYYVWDGNSYFSSAQDEDQIAIIFTGNMNGKLTAKNDEASMARVMTQITQLRREYTDSYLIDAGNFTGKENRFGSALAESFELKAMETMAYDAVGIGAKELSLGKDAAARYLEAAIKDDVNTKEYFAYPALLCANLNWDKIANGALKTAFEKFTPEATFEIVEKYGSKLGFVGVNEEQGNTVDSANNAIKKLKKADKDLDGIVLVYNGDDVKTLAKGVKGVDLIIANPSESKFSQKESEEDREPVVINGINVVETTGIAGVGQIVFEKGKKGLEVISLKSYLVDDSTYENTAITHLYSAQLAAIDKSYFGLFGFSGDGVIGTNTVHFKGFKEQGNSALGDLISDAYKYVGKKYSDETAELAGSFFASGTVKNLMHKGSITASKLYKMFDRGISKDGLSGANLVDVYVSGAELKILAEIDASISERDENVGLYFSGIKYKYNPHRFYRNRVSDVYINGDEEVEPRALYRLITDEKTIQFIQDADKAPFGLMDIQFKDKDGKELQSFDKQAIEYKEQSVKQWVALAKYIDKKGISSSYKDAENRKVLVDDKSLGAILSNPGKIFLVTLLAAIIAISVVILIVSIVLRALGLSRNSFYRRHRRENKQQSIFKHRKNRYKRNMKYRKK